MLPVAAARIPSIKAGGLGMLPIGSVGIGTESTLSADPIADARLQIGEAFALQRGYVRCGLVAVAERLVRPDGLPMS